METNNEARSKPFIIKNDRLFYEKDRLATFIDWPRAYAISPHELARDGFFYTRRYGGLCICVFCNLAIHAEEGPSKVKAPFHDCPSVKGGLNPLNVPIAHDAEEEDITVKVIKQSPTGGDVWRRSSIRLRSLSSSMSDKNVVAASNPFEGRRRLGGEGSGTSLAGASALEDYRHREPIYKNYFSLEDRLDSFKKREKETETEQLEVVRPMPKAKKLAEAGFYHYLFYDHVICFYCGGGLNNWKENADPWIEHARWYPNCYFVLLSRGQNFINKVRKNEQSVRQTPSSSSSSSSSPPRPSRKRKKMRNHESNRNNEDEGKSQQRADEGKRKYGDEEGENLIEAINAYATSSTKLFQRINRKLMCKICMSDEISVLFIPCLHMSSCHSCAFALETCPFCRAEIKYVFRPNFL